MGPIRNTEETIRIKFNVAAGRALHDRVLAHVRQAAKQFETTPAPRGPVLRRTIMRNPIAKVAAAAGIIAVLILFIGLWDRSIPSAYAIEQTIEANRSVRCLHIKNFTTGHEEPREGWIEFGEDGQVRRVRANMPEWASPVDGARVFVWKDGTVQMWLKRQNRLAIMKADDPRKQLNAALQEFDPRLALSRINDLKSQGEVEIAIQEPSDKTHPITMTVTYLPDSDDPGRRKVLSIDPATKLINTIEIYQSEEGQYRHTARIELQEYNQPIDPKMFDLVNEAPANAERLDLSGTDLGLAQGSLSDEEAATGVVRQFFESLIAGDYDTAGRLIPVGATALKEHFGGVKILRIISVGPATSLSGPGNTKLAIPCTIEYEDNGQKGSTTLKGITVQQLPERPGRWVIQTLGD